MDSCTADLSVLLEEWLKFIKSSSTVCLVHAHALFAIDRKCYLSGSATPYAHLDSRPSAPDAKKCTFLKLVKLTLMERSSELASLTHSWSTILSQSSFLPRYTFTSLRLLDSTSKESADQSTSPLLEDQLNLSKAQCKESLLKRPKKSKLAKLDLW